MFSASSFLIRVHLAVEQPSADQYNIVNFWNSLAAAQHRVSDVDIALTALLCNRKIFVLFEELLQVRQREAISLEPLDGLIGVRDEGDEERQHHVDEQGDKGVEVGPAEEPHQSVFVLQLGEGGEHVVAVQEGEQALRYTTQALKLLMVWPQYNPSTEGVAEVDHTGTAAKTQDLGEGCFHS